MELEFSLKNFDKTYTYIFIKIRPVGAEFHAEEQTDRQNETHSRFSKICERA